VTQQFVAQAGVEYDGHSAKPIQHLTNTLSFQPPALTQANGSALVALSAELIGKIYGITGPTITLTAT
jgi:hypothetical protein